MGRLRVVYFYRRGANPRVRQGGLKLPQPNEPGAGQAAHAAGAPGHPGAGMQPRRPLSASAARARVTMRRTGNERMTGAPSAGSVVLRLARPADAHTIANMSRELIENGLGWSWRRERVEMQIGCQDTVALVAESRRCIVGFAIMYFGAEVAHLNLLAVARTRQRKGVGRRLIAWLEKSARVAGIASVRLEVRAKNRGARAFYRALGYQEIALAPRYYRGRESAVRMEHSLIPIEVRDGAAPARDGL